MTSRVVKTRAGTPAMLDLITGEVMHPVGDPGEESRELYVRGSRLGARLLESRDDPLVVLDIGLGAASNAVAAWEVSESRTSGGRPLRIVSFDNTTDPLIKALEPEHASSFGLTGMVEEAARQLLTKGAARGRHTTWHLAYGDLPNTLSAQPADAADVVYWDMFSPKSDPRLWSVAMFASLRRACRSGATMHTYAASTASRAALLLAGFFVGRGPITGDRETTMAAVTLADLDQPLDARWLARLSRSSVPFPADAPTDAMARLLALEQFRE